MTWKAHTIDFLVMALAAVVSEGAPGATQPVPVEQVPTTCAFATRTVSTYQPADAPLRRDPAVLVLLAGVTPLPRDPWWQASHLMPHFERVALWLADFLPAEVKDNVRFDFDSPEAGKLR